MRRDIGSQKDNPKFRLDTVARAYTFRENFKIPNSHLERWQTFPINLTSLMNRIFKPLLENGEKPMKRREDIYEQTRTCLRKIPNRSERTIPNGCEEYDLSVVSPKEETAWYLQLDDRPGGSRRCFRSSDRIPDFRPPRIRTVRDRCSHTIAYFRFNPSSPYLWTRFFRQPETCTVSGIETNEWWRNV